MLEPFYTQCEQVFGRDHPKPRALKRFRVELIGSSYNIAESHGMEDIPDGTTVRIEAFSNGCFQVSIDSETSFEDKSEPSVLTVPVAQVIMVPESDVVLHSLKGAKHLNGKLGIATGFDCELGRYTVIVEGSSQRVNVKPQNLIPAYMGCEKEVMINLALELSSEHE